MISLHGSINQPLINTTPSTSGTGLHREIPVTLFSRITKALVPLLTDI